MRVLVADDSAVARFSVCGRLRAAGLDVLEHDSAKAARGADPAVLMCALLDLDLGDGTGVEVAEALHAASRERSPRLPIAFFSGGAPDEIMARARAIGPLFSKPGQLEQAIAWVLACLRATHRP